MRFSVRVNNDLGFAELLALAEAAERAGFDQLWVYNDLFLRSAPVLAGALAARTGRIGLGISIMNPYSVHVSELAMAAATVQEVSGGRFLLGLGAGAEQFLGWAGIARTRPLATTRTALVVLRTLLGHRDVDASLLPEWFGPDSVLRFPVGRRCRSTSARWARRCSRWRAWHADGVLPLLYPPERYAAVRQQVLAGAAPGRREIDLLACFWVSLSGDPAAARAALAEKLAYYGPSIRRRCSPRPGCGRRTSGRPLRWRTAGRWRPGSSTTACWPSAWPGTRPTCWPGAARCDGWARSTCRSARRWDRTRSRLSACWARRCCPL